MSFMGSESMHNLTTSCITLLVCHLAAFFQSGCSWYWNMLIQDTLCWLHSRWSHISSSFEAYNAWNRFPLTLWLDMVRTFYWFAVMSVHQKSVTRDESLVLIAFGHHVAWCGGRMKSTMFGCDMLRCLWSSAVPFALGTKCLRSTLLWLQVSSYY